MLSTLRPARRPSRRGTPQRRPLLRVEALEPRALLAASAFAAAVNLPPEVGTPSYDLWGLNNTGQSGGKADADIDAPEAWGRAGASPTGSTAVTVAVIDTGVDYTHKDLYLNIWINQGEIPTAAGVVDADGDDLITFRDLNDVGSGNRALMTDVNGTGYIDGGDILVQWSDKVDADANGFKDDLIGWDFIGNDNNPLDGNGHGTHVTGTIAATAGDGGVVGVNWTAQVMALQFMRADGSGTTTAAADAIRYAADNGAKVSNNSWLYYAGSTSDAVYSAVSYARGKGHLVVAAAGNDGLNNDKSFWRAYPASFSLDNVLSVAATDRNDARPRWSNYGAKTVDLGAPGVGVWSTVPKSVDVYDGVQDGYAAYSGTSMAAPHVTGAAALVWANNPGLSYTQVEAAILQGVDKVSALATRTVTGGRLNLDKALAAAETMTPAAAPASSAPASGGTGGTVQAGAAEVGPAAIDLASGAAAAADRPGTPDAPGPGFSRRVPGLILRALRQEFVVVFIPAPTPVQAPAPLFIGPAEARVPPPVSVTSAQARELVRSNQRGSGSYVVVEEEQAPPEGERENPRPEAAPEARPEAPAPAPAPWPWWEWLMACDAAFECVEQLPALAEDGELPVAPPPDRVETDPAKLATTLGLALVLGGWYHAPAAARRQRERLRSAG